MKVKREDGQRSGKSGKKKDPEIKKTLTEGDGLLYPCPRYNKP